MLTKKVFLYLESQRRMFAHEYDKLKFDRYTTAVAEWKNSPDVHGAEIDLLPVVSHDLGYSETDLSTSLHALVRNDEPLTEADRYHLKEVVRQQGKSAA